MIPTVCVQVSRWHIYILLNQGVAISRCRIISTKLVISTQNENDLQKTGKFQYEIEESLEVSFHISTQT